MAPEIIRYTGHDKACDYWSWGVLVYRLVTGKYPFHQDGNDELSLYKRICSGTFQLDGMTSVEFRLLMVAVLYPDPVKRLGYGVNGWRDIFSSPWFTQSKSFDVEALRNQELVAPWVPELGDDLDASRFHPDMSNMVGDTTTDRVCLSDQQQAVFSSFGPSI